MGVLTVSAMNDGGPAFPRTRSVDASGNKTLTLDSCSYIESIGGMSLRDYFAGQALAGYLARGDPIGSYENAAIISYRQADAMLSARAQPSTEGKGLTSQQPNQP